MYAMTKFLKVTIRGKTQKECEEGFELISSMCDAEVKEFDKKINYLRKFDGRRKK